jgi:hypothetical protein
MNKFEQLIEYVINDDEAKARELFHDIVVEKSRTIYEEMMAADEELNEGLSPKIKKIIDAYRELYPKIAYDADGEDLMEPEEAHEETCSQLGVDPSDMDEYFELEDEELEEGMMGGEQAGDLIDDIETEESGISMDEAEDDDMDMDDHHSDMGGNEDLEDRVVDLEDKLDELMAEFESLMGDDAGGDEEMDAEMDMEVGDGMSDEEVVDDELETEGMYENVDLKAAPKPVTSEEGGVNKKSTVAANSGAKGAIAKPVSMTGDTAHGRTAPTAKDMGSTTQPNVKPATKPHLAQASGVNNKSVIQ